MHGRRLMEETIFVVVDDSPLFLQGVVIKLALEPGSKKFGQISKVRKH